MAKIDISKIDGYADMTQNRKLPLLKRSRPKTPITADM